MKYSYLYALAFVCLLSPVSHFATPTNLELDTTFNAGVTDGYSRAYVSLPLPDGKIIVGGTFRVVNGTERQYLARLNNDGSLDPSFNTGGEGPNGQIYAVERLADGKLLIGGFFTSYNGNSISGIARLNPDGTLDPTFDQSGPGVAGGVQTITVQPDGKILIGSNFSAYNTIPRIAIARLNPDGTLDESFVSPFTSSSFVEEIYFLPDGKIIIAGMFTLDGKRDLTRLNPDGSRDIDFNTAGNGGDGRGIFALAVQGDGKIIIGGAFETYNGTPSNRVARVNSDGSHDPTFSSPFMDGKGIESLDLLSDGKLLVAGSMGFGGNENLVVARLNNNGSYDNSFSASVGDFTGYHLTSDPDGKILLAGWFNTVNGFTARNLVRMNANGAVDDSFTTSLNQFSQVFDLAVQPDGKVVVVGNFNVANGISQKHIARFHADGALDTAFTTGSGVFPDPNFHTSHISTVAVQPDGKVLVGGTFGGYNGAMSRGIFRLNADGSFDSSFTPPFEHPFPAEIASIQHILIQPDGKILVAGQTYDFNFVGRHLFRLNPDGSFDNSFTHQITNAAPLRLALQSDGKVIAVGAFTTVGGIAHNRIVRLNSNGSIDSAFSTGSGANNQVHSVAVQPDGKILIGGNFTAFNGTPITRFTRLNSNGSVDPGFDIGAGFDASVTGIAIQADGKIVASGAFSSYNGHNTNRLARVNGDGGPDTSFVSGFEEKLPSNNFARRVAIQTEGKILVVGDFRQYAGVSKDSILRLSEAETQSTAPFDFDGDGKTDVSIFRPANGEWWYGKSSDGGHGAAAFGTATDVIVPADYTGDGKTDIAFFRPSTGEWFVLRSEDFLYYSFPFGTAGDIPAPADYDGDGKADVAVYRPSTGTWYILRSSDGQVVITSFGVAGDQPVPADYDADGKADIGVFRPNGPSGAEWWILRSTEGLLAVQFGSADSKAVPGDYTGDGKADVAFFSSTGGWYILRSEDMLFYSFPFGLGSDLPVPGDYDGDGKIDAAVFRNSEAAWYMLGSSSGTIIRNFGASGDRPVPNAFVR